MSKTSVGTRKFLSGLVPILIVALAACVSFTAVSRKLINEIIKSKTQATVDNLVDEVSRELSPIETKLDDFACVTKITGDVNALDKCVRGIAVHSNYCTSFYYAPVMDIRSPGGYYLDSSDWTPPDDWIPQERDWFIGARSRNGEIYYSDAYLDSMTGELCVSFAKAAFTDGNDFLGVVSCDLVLNELCSIVENIKISSNGSIYLVTDKGYYLTNSDSSKIMSGNYFDDSALSKKGFSINEYLDGKKKNYIIGGKYYLASKVGNTPWFVVAEGPVSDFSKSYTMVIIAIIAFLIVLSGICTYINGAYISRMGKKNVLLGQDLLEQMKKLEVTTKDSAATSQDQSAAVKEIVATMEDNTELSNNISGKIRNVTQVAEHTAEDVTSGIETLLQNVEQLNRISSANRQTIEGIKDLGAKVNNIWDIVTLINNVADQAKIIAFNAELEASSAGEAGKNFHIVASEIRRLADGIIDGTKEIKDSITEIQKSSDFLILTSESGTKTIEEGCEKVSELEKKFNSIKDSSEITVTSSNEIQQIISQQAVSSSQILTALKQIAEGVEDFKNASMDIFESVEKGSRIAEVLNGKTDRD